MTTFVQAKCQCGLNVFNVGFPTASLPISNTICHCNSCRHGSGQFGRNHAPVQGVPISPLTSEEADVSNLAAYKSSDNVTRRFCATCSTYMFAQRAGQPDWFVSVGALDRPDDIVASKSHIFLSDTKDGGFADHLREIDGHILDRYSVRPKNGEQEGSVLPVGWNEIKAKEHENLSLYCHCKSVSLRISRPNADSALPSHMPYPDILYAVHSTPGPKMLNPDDEKWWLCPPGTEKPTKFLAGYCACTACTRSGGTEVQPWLFIPTTNIEVVSDASAELGLVGESKLPKGMKRYVSSVGRGRDFCGTCGANVFLWVEGRTEVALVAGGLVDQEQGGARAEGWFKWCKDRVSFVEDAIRQSVAKGLEKGLKDSE